MLPMSREVSQLARLKQDVARYRLVFGQPRQDDLLDYLGDVPPDKLAELRIDLTANADGTSHRALTRLADAPSESGH